MKHLLAIGLLLATCFTSCDMDGAENPANSSESAAGAGQEAGSTSPGSYTPGAASPAATDSTVLDTSAAGMTP
ncbi:MAG: hypothetical protein EOP49_15440 [Sphingobacteriales bacterium]|nr:MAG: hypothetical protein EOP49_15440 [Sphingobacteriales bacterium]